VLLNKYRQILLLFLLFVLILTTTTTTTTTTVNGFTLGKNSLQRSALLHATDTAHKGKKLPVETKETECGV